MSPSRMLGAWSAAMLLCAFAWSVPAPAIQVDYGAGLMLTYETNVNRTETNPISELTQSVMAGAFFRETNSEVTARMLAQVEHRHFTRGSNSDDTTAFIDEHTLWSISPERFTWLLDDTFREVQLNVTAPDTPSNRAKSNTLNTGPDLTLKLSSANSLVFGGRYGRFDVENSTSDNRRYGGLARVVHALSPVSNVSLNYQAVRVYFEPESQTPFPKVLREDWYGRYESLYAGNSASLELGTSRVTRYGGDQLDGRLLRFSLLRARTPETAFRVGYADEISDTYSDVIRSVTVTDVPTDPGVVVIGAGGFATSDVYHSKRGEIAYLNRGGFVEYTLLGYGRKVDFETLEEDYDEKGVRFGLNWTYSPSLRFNAFGEYVRRTYLILTADPTDPSAPFRQDTDRNTYAGVDYKLNANLTLTLTGQLARRISNVPGLSFEDRRVMLLLGFAPPGLVMQSRR